MTRVTLKSRIFSGAAIAASVVLGCAPVATGGLQNARNADRSNARLTGTFTANAARASISSSTVSFALDRIDQRGLPLDRTYARTGTGRGVTVYVFDGGISTDHPELEGRVRLGYSAFPRDPRICNAHGTAVAGAIAGRTLGVAPEATIVDVKMVECGSLRGTIRGIVEGARWAIEDHRRRGGPAVANWSFIADTSATIPALDSAVRALRAAGIPVVVSAGNVDVNACQVSPANSPGSIVVGASALLRDSTAGRLTVLDRRAPGTAWGPCIDVYAPGDSVLLPSLDGQHRAISQVWNGTSMAAGYVSGAAALYLEAMPTARPDEVLAHLRRTGTANVVRESGAAATTMLFVGTESRIPQARVAVRP